MSYKISAVNIPLTDITYKSNMYFSVTRNSSLPKAMRSTKALRSKELPSDNEGWGLILVDNSEKIMKGENHIKINDQLRYIDEDDVIKFNPSNNSIGALYRHRANANGFLLTEQCNSFCIMCSQPPKKVNDLHLFDNLFKSLPLIPKSCREITFTGGEPTINFNYFLEALRRAKFHLPNTSIHVLSNGRNFINEDKAKDLSKIAHHDVMFGIPLYSDDMEIHDFVVQSKGAFDETIKGILNLYKYKIKVEIRVVVHKYTWERLPELSEFISRNLPFVSHVNFMGLEKEGFGNLNFKDLWVDPEIFMENFDIAVNHLDMMGIPVRLYNYPLCMLPDSLWERAIVSISDWKNDFRDECNACNLKDKCCGLFKSLANEELVKVRPIG